MSDDIEAKLVVEIFKCIFGANGWKACIISWLIICGVGFGIYVWAQGETEYRDKCHEKGATVIRDSNDKQICVEKIDV